MDTQDLKITGTLHHEWKRMNLLGDFQYLREDDSKCPIYHRKTRTSLGSEVYLYRTMGKWRIGPNYDANNCWLFLESNASEPLSIREDQKRTKEVWQEHKSGEWFPVKNLKIRDPNRVKKSKANQQPTRKPNKDMKNDRSDGYSDCSSDISSDISSETLIKYATPRCLRKIRVGSSGDEVFF